MIFGDLSKQAMRVVATLWMAVLLALAPQAVIAQDAPAADTAASVQAPSAAGDAVAEDGKAAAGSYTPLGPDMIKGQPTPGGVDFQKQYTDNGQFAYNMHNHLLMPVITVIVLFVLGLILFVVMRFRRGRNPVPSKTTHNTLIEVVWTLVPVLILVGIAVPSISLLARQYETPPEDAVTIKAVGYQWYWGYEYPDNGGIEVISNMLPKDQAIAAGLPAQLAVDNRMVVPANTPLRIQTTGADVIHSFAVPSLWFKLDAVPGRLNERLLTITEPGIYYGQCSELCGVRHGYMPIAVEALPRDQWEAWVLSQGGTVGDPKQVAEDAASAADAEAAGDTAGVAEADAAEAAAE